MKDKLRKDLFEQRTKEWDNYYNRPSIQTSYQIAVIAAIGLILTVLSLIVSEVVYDFDHTFIDQFREPKTETIYQEETMAKEGILA